MYQGKKLTAAERIAKAQGKTTNEERPRQPDPELITYLEEDQTMHRDTQPPTDWSPERKIVGAAIATILCFTIQATTGIDFPIGIEGAVAVIAGYLIPNKR